uniref:ATP synthase F0 subunit 8 n=1 Tax=Romanomermis culicivorax TaxID=13658 RepID=A0A915IC87_ROMCU
MMTVSAMFMGVFFGFLFTLLFNFQHFLLYLFQFRNTIARRYATYQVAQLQNKKMQKRVFQYVKSDIYDRFSCFSLKTLKNESVQHLFSGLNV